MNTEWRRMPTEADREQYARRLAREIAERITAKWDRGEQEHGPGFHGDPIQHLYDELVDAFVYLHYIDKQRASLVEALESGPGIDLDQLRKELAHEPTP